MTAPGLAMFYGGLVRRKNVLSVMMQCIFLMGLMTVIWATFGYSLAFGGDGGWIGNTDYFFMNGVQREWNDSLGVALTPMEGDMARLTHMLCSGNVLHHYTGSDMRCVCGANEICRDGSLLGSMGCIHLLPIMPLGVGWRTSVLRRIQHRRCSLLISRSTVVHISSGISALVAALMIGPRMGFLKEPLQPHNLTYTALGAAMLWFGWFGFNAGSELASDGLTSSAFAVTHFAAAAGAYRLGDHRMVRFR